MLDFRKSLIHSTLRKVLKRLHYPLEVMITCVRWYVAYPLSLRHIEAMMQERGVFVDHATVHLWAIRMLPILAAVFRRRKHAVGRSWRMDETYIKGSGQWKYLYRAVDHDGDTVDFLLTAKRDLAAAQRFLERAINLHAVPEKITIDKSGSNTATIESVKADACVDILMRQSKCLNNIVEQERRGIERITRSMLGFKSFGSARITIRRNRDHAHDPQGAVGLSRWQNHVRSQPVMQPCSLIASPTVQLPSARLHYFDRTIERTTMLAESESRFRSMADSAPVLIWISGLDKRVFWLNKRWLDFTGRTMEQEVGSGWTEGLHPDDFDRGVTTYVSAFDTGQGFELEFRLRRFDGEYRWLVSSGVPRFNEQGRFSGYIGSCLDITDRKRTEQGLIWQSEKNLALLHNASDGITIMNGNANIIEVSESFCNMLGYSRDEMMGLNVTQWDCGFKSKTELMLAVQQQFEHPTRSPFQTLHRCKDGSIYSAEISSYPVKLDGMMVPFNTVRDITQRKHDEERLQLAASVFSDAGEGIIIADAQKAIVDVNEAFTRITGYSRDDAIGQNPRILSSGRQDKAFYEGMWNALNLQGHWSGEIWNRRKDGEVFAELLTISSVRDSQDKTQQYVALFSDITAIKVYQSQLEHIAHFDALTNLPNRLLLADRLQQAMAQAQRRDQQVAVVYLDLDGFKNVNDLYGHAVGDQLLIALATAMKDTLRKGDTLARLGGDEFVAVLTNLDNVESCLPMLTRLVEAAAAPVQLGEQVLQRSASIGVSFYPQADGIEADQLLRQADQAMYQAKLAGKNRYHIFDAVQARSIREYHESLERIRLALTQSEFVLHYQPKVNMRSGQVIGAEALIRWQHPDKGLLAPATFLPVIEDHPLAVEVGEWVIDAALSQIEVWQAMGLDHAVSVNIGARQLQQGDFVQRLQAILAKHPQVKPSSLELEVLETSALADIEQVSQAIEACHQMAPRQTVWNLAIDGR